MKMMIAVLVFSVVFPPDEDTLDGEAIPCGMRPNDEPALETATQYGHYCTEYSNTRTSRSIALALTLARASTPIWCFLRVFYIDVG